MKITLQKITTSGELPVGSLFLYNKTIALKSKYRTDGKSDAYIVGSGEYFWGGTNNREDREKLEISELKIK